MTVATRAGDAGPDAARVKVFVTNDVHGYVFEDEAGKRIGYARLQGYIDAARAQGYRTILLDAGDAFSGNTLAQYDAGLGVAELMGRLGYRVLAPGNHAFDYNASSGNMRYYTDVLVDTVADFAKDPLDIASVNLRSIEEPLPRVVREPVVVIDEDGFRLIVMGVLTPYARSASSPENTAGFYAFGLVETEDGRPDHAATKQRLLDAAARAARPYDRPGDVVVLLSHVGDDDTDDYRRGQLRGSDFAALPNIDFVVDAHTHNHVPVREIGAAQYGNAGRYLERFTEITLSREGGAAGGVRAHVDYDGAKAAARPSEEMLMRLREMSDRMGLGDRLFRVPGDFLADAGVSDSSTPLGRFICKSMNDIAGADLSLFNSGSIRSGLPDGWVTLGTLYDVIPFQNNLVTFSMTGQAIAQFFADMPLRKTNPFPQFYGMSVHAWDRGPDSPLGIAGIRDGSGAVLDPAKKYTVAINSFMASGGDGYSFTLTDKRDHGDQMALFAQYLRDIGAPDFAAMRENNTLLVYPAREEAERAFAE
jgi:2',3'-cyclic-nucleotide 2'-phosphodiesterase (5'-nucleotidase family)